MSGHLCRSPTKKNKTGQKEIKMYTLRRKRTLGNVMLEPSLMLKGTRSLKKVLMLNEIERVVRSRQDPTPSTNFLLSYFSTAVKNTMTKATEEKKELIWGSQFRMYVIIMEASMAAGRHDPRAVAQSLILIPKHKAERANWKWHGFLKPCTCTHTCTSHTCIRSQVLIHTQDMCLKC